MRRHPCVPVVLVLLVLTPAAPARAQIAVDTLTRTIETSKLRLRFSATCPEQIVQIVYKPYSPTNAVDGEAPPWEFSGQMIQGLWAAQGPIFSQSIVAQSWRVLSQTSTRLVLRIESQSFWSGQPQTPVRTDYTFFADSSGFQVERTAFFSSVAMNATSLQPYVLRLSQQLFTNGRFRSSAHAPLAVSYCTSGCMTSDWDQRWSRTQGPNLACTVMYASGNPHPMNLMGDNDSFSFSLWSVPLTPSQNFTSDVTWRMFVHFTTTPDDDALSDAVYEWFDALPNTAVGDRAGASIVLAVTPNPARGSAALAYTLPVAGDVTVEVLDVSGRRVATIERGERAAGAHVARWDGRNEHGAPAPTGLYFARVASPAGERRARIVWLR